MRFADQESPKRDARTQQCAREETALEIPPRVQHVLRAHAARGTRRFAVAHRCRAVRGNHAVAVVQNLVADEKCQLILQALLLPSQTPVDEHGCRSLEARPHERAAGLAGIAVEPLDLQSMTLADRHERAQGQGQLPIAALLRGTLDIGKIVVPRLLPYANQQLGELPARGAGLRQQLGQCVLQQLVREQKRRLQRHGLQAAALMRRGHGLDGRILVQEPARILAEDSGQHLQHLGRRHALAGFHHAQVGHRRRAAGVDLHATRRQFIQGQAVALAQRAQLRAEKVSLSDEAGHCL